MVFWLTYGHLASKEGSWSIAMTIEPKNWGQLNNSNSAKKLGHKTLKWQEESMFNELEK